MAKTAPAARVPVTATGIALIAMIAEAGGSLMLTQAEGAELIAAGHAVVDTSVVENDTALVSLTDAGRAALDEENGSAEVVNTTVSGGIEIEDGVPVPTTTSRAGRSGGYPFDKLNVGQSFHVPKTKENEDPASRLASSVSGARAKYAKVLEGQDETVTVKEYQRNEAGKGFAKDSDGKRIVIGEHKETRPKTEIVRDFIVKTVDASDPKGEGARVWRTK